MMPNRTRGFRRAVVVLLGAAGVGPFLGCDDPGPARASISVAAALTDTDTAGYARARSVPELRFPEDHGPHPEYKHEWWYFTGTLEAGGEAGAGGSVSAGSARSSSAGGKSVRPRDGEDDAAGREFGFQLTFFRSALRPDSVQLESPWSTRQAYMAHFAVSDIDRGRFHAFERFDRGALGLAGAGGTPMRVWLGDWGAKWIPDGRPDSGQGSGQGSGRFHLRAARDGLGLDLVLTPTQPVVLQGEAGLSRKGPEAGNASYYYSMMRLHARGTVSTGEATYAVAGDAWLDREWGTSALSPGVVGWDWFSLQLDDDSELMLYRLRRADGRTAPFSAGTFVHPDGSVIRLSADEFEIEATDGWTSPRGVRYPSDWRVRVPGLDLFLRVQPRLADQELDLAFRYWEGAVAARGRRERREVAGKGYVELTGY